MRTYNYTCIRQVQTTTYPGYTRTGRARHKRTYTRESTKCTPVHVKDQAPAYTNQEHRSGCPYRTLSKHKHSRILRASFGLFMPNTVQVQVQCVRISTSTHVHYVRRSGCTCIRTEGTPKHAGLRTIDASLRLSMSNSVHVRVQCARPSMRTSVH